MEGKFPKWACCLVAVSTDKMRIFMLWIRLCKAMLWGYSAVQDAKSNRMLSRWRSWAYGQAHRN